MPLSLTRRKFLELLGASALTGALAPLTGCARKCSRETLEIVPRETWGAVAPNVAGSVEGPYDAVTNPGGWYLYSEPLDQVLTTVVVHHSALPPSDGPPEIQEKHMHAKGYADVGYHFLIDAEGEIYAGRDVGARGAHTGGHNTGTIGVCLLGNFEEREPREAQLTSLKTLSRCLRDTYRLTHLAGHLDFQPGVTLCPGKNLERRLPALAEEIRLAFGTGGYAGPPGS